MHHSPHSVHALKCIRLYTVSINFQNQPRMHNPRPACGSDICQFSFAAHVDKYTTFRCVGRLLTIYG